MKGLFVERAQARDAAALARLMAACHRHPWSEDQVAAELAQAPPSTVLMARSVDGQPRGACAYRVTLDEMEILDVSVDAAWRRRGLARFLVLLALARGARAGARRAYLEVRAANAPARALYAGLGFGERGRRRGYYREPPDDALVLERPLAEC